jgi:hypothetical protein
MVIGLGGLGSALPARLRDPAVKGARHLWMDCG